MKLTVIYKDYQPTLDGLQHTNCHVAPDVRRVTIKLTPEQEVKLIRKTRTEELNMVFFESETPGDIDCCCWSFDHPPCPIHGESKPYKPFERKE